MATNIFSGSEGIVYVGNTAVASIRSFSLEETQETIDATTMNTSGVAFRTNKPTFKSWSGTVDVFWTTEDSSTDNFGPTSATATHVEQGGSAPSDSAGASGDADLFGILQPGKDEVTLHFWFSGDDTGELGYTGTCLITNRSISSSVDGMVEATISVLGTAALETEVGGWTGTAA
jgi:hypothetical protein